MKSLMTCAGVLCVAAVYLVVPEASALALAPQVPKPAVLKHVGGGGAVSGDLCGAASFFQAAG